MTGDLRFAVRHLLRRPASTLVVVLTLAVGVGANASMFTLVDAMLFRPAPWGQTGRLLWITTVRGHAGSVSYPDYLAYRDRATTFDGVVAFGGNGVAVGAPHPERVLGGLVSGNYFDVLGIRPALGRTLTPADDGAPGAQAVVVLSDAFWRSHFGADPGVVDRSVAINGRPFRIVGVAQAGFTGVAYGDDPEDLWMPLAMTPVAIPEGVSLASGAAWLRVVGRLRATASAGQADAEVRVIARQLNPPGTPREREKSARVSALRGGMTPWEQDDFGPIFGLISLVPVLVLIVACANVANVLLASHLSRRRELAMRRAIGASRARLVRQLLAESLLLAAGAGAVGFALSFVLIAAIARVAQIPDDFTALLTPDRRILLASAAAAFLATLAFGLAPAMATTRFDVLPALKAEGGQSTAAPDRRRAQRAFLVAQMALSLVLLVVAGLFLGSLSKAMRVDPGFDPRGVVTASFDTALQGYTPARRAEVMARFLERAAAAPGAIAAAAATPLPLSGELRGAELVADGSGARANATMTRVTPGYFATMRLPLVRGREFAPSDTAASAPVAIVDRTLAAELWPTGNPIGQRLRVASDKDVVWREVVGVAGDARYLDLTEEPRGGYYTPDAQQPDSRISIVMRTSADGPAALANLRAIAAAIDPDLALFAVRTLDDGIRRTLGIRRAVASLLTVFGGLTLLLASIGLYGVAAHNASSRTREVGIRMSLGARPPDVTRLFLSESLRLSAIGAAAGLALSAASSRLLASFLFGLGATDAVTFAAAAGVLCLVAAAASWLPAARASRLDPAIALRHD